MFCHKCGTQIAEGASFCYKCGTKVVYPDISQPPLDAPAATDSLNITDSPVQADAHVNVSSSDKDAFKSFVDNHIRATTQYQTAEELLNSHVPQRFVWACFGVPGVWSAIGFLRMHSFSLTDWIGIIAFILLAGYFAACLFDMIFTVRITLQTGKNSIKFQENLDTDDLVSFLNDYFEYLHPWFHQWGYMETSGVGVANIIAASAINAAAERANEITLGSGFGRKQKCFIRIIIKNDVTAINAGYSFGASTRAFVLWPAKYASLTKAAPILQAAMEYYLEIYKKS